MSATDRELLMFPSLPHVFVRTLLGAEDRAADVLLHDAVPPEDIIDVWQPGDADYDRHVDLPGT